MNCRIFSWYQKIDIWIWRYQKMKCRLWRTWIWEVTSPDRSSWKRTTLASLLCLRVKAAEFQYLANIPSSQTRANQPSIHTPIQIYSYTTHNFSITYGPTRREKKVEDCNSCIFRFPSDRYLKSDNTIVPGQLTKLSREVNKTKVLLIAQHCALFLNKNHFKIL